MDRRDLLARAAQAAAFAVVPRALARFSPRPVASDLMSPRLDAHAHLMSRELATYFQGRIGDRSLRGLVRPINGRIVVDQLEEDGVERAFALSTAYIHATELGFGGGRKSARDEYRDVQDENTFTAGEAAEFSGKLIPFGSVNPKRDYAVDELVRCVETLHMRGFKVHFAHSDVRLRDPTHLAAVRALFAAAAARNLPIVAHFFNGAVSGFGAPDAEIFIRDVVQPLPDLRVVIAHVGGDGGSEEDGALRIFAALVAAVARHPAAAARVWVDLSGVLVSDPWPPLPLMTPAQQVRLGDLIKAWGVEQVLWGSDVGTEALTQARPLWPLGRAEWETLANHDGSTLWRRV
jgi:predicted TIM-barrel fold metal-dependent hydrolase